MVDNTWFDAQFKTNQYMAILRGFGHDRTLALARSAWSAGVTLIEIPVQKAADLTTLSALAAEGERYGHQVGAGTVLTVEQVTAVRSAGAGFIVSPGFDPEVIAAADRVGLAALPGVATATEVSRAINFGLIWLKAFPAISLGSDWVRQMHGPFPQAKFVATGGMNLNSAQQFLDAGAKAVAIGSAVEQLAAVTP